MHQAHRTRTAHVHISHVPLDLQHEYLNGSFVVGISGDPVDRRAHGWRGDSKDHVSVALPDAIAPLFALCHRRQIDVIRFDADGEVLAGYPQHRSGL